MDETSALSSETEDENGEQASGAAEQALNDAAKRVNAVWISFVLLCVYIFIATYTVTPAVLFREAPVKLPIFNADLPLKVYFLLAPFLILSLHAYLIVLAKGLAEKFDAFERDLRQSKVLRSRLDNSIIMRAMSARYSDTSGFLDMASGVIVGLTTIVLPVWLLLLTQLIFLPYQSEWLTWAHRGFVVFDVALCLWLLWPFSRATWPIIAGRLVAVALILIAAATSIFFATFPGEWIYDKLFDHWPQAVTAKFFEGPLDPVDYVHHGGVLPFPNRLILPDDPKLIGIADTSTASLSLSVRGRNFRKAVFDRSNLTGVDFSAADLTEASLQGAKLEGAKFECGTPGNVISEPLDATGYVERAPSRDCTKLQQANLWNASLDNAKFQEAWMTDTKLGRASLKGASFRGARMNGATLQVAAIEGANFSGVESLGANFDWARGKNANFSKARMTASTFFNAWLFAANFKDARLQGAHLPRANLAAADFDNAHIQGADLSRADLVAASLKGAYLQDATLESANIKGASFVSASLRGASLNCATPFRTAFWEPARRGSPIVDPRMPDSELSQTVVTPPHTKCETYENYSYGNSVSYIIEEDTDKFDKIGDGAQSVTGFDFGGDYGWGSWVYADDILIEPEKLSPKDFEVLLSTFLANLPDKTKDYVRKAFERLKPEAQTKEQDEAEKAFWAEWPTHSASPESHAEALAARLESIACVSEGAPYVARGLLRAGRFDRLGEIKEQNEVYKKRIIARLKAASDGTDSNCLGARGLRESDFPPADGTRTR